MFDWFRKRKYRNEVWTNVLTLTTLVDDESSRLLPSLVPGADDHIDEQYRAGANPYVLAVNLSSIILSTIIEQSDPEIRQRSAEQLTRLLDGEQLDNNPELFVTRFRLMSRMAKRLERDGLIQTAHREMLEHEVYGALLGMDRQERSNERILSVLHDGLLSYSDD